MFCTTEEQENKLNSYTSVNREPKVSRCYLSSQYISSQCKQIQRGNSSFRKVALTTAIYTPKLQMMLGKNLESSGSSNKIVKVSLQQNVSPIMLSGKHSRNNSASKWSKTVKRNTSDVSTVVGCRLLSFFRIWSLALW